MDVSAHNCQSEVLVVHNNSIKKSLPFHLSHTKPEKVERGARATGRNVCDWQKMGIQNNNKSKWNFDVLTCFCYRENFLLIE